MICEQSNVCVLGSGIWGTAIACAIERKFGSCVIFTKNTQTFEQINTLHTNKGAKFASSIKAELNYAKLAEYQNIVLATPSYALYDVLPVIKSLPVHIGIIVATKGLDIKKQQLISTTLQDEVVNPVMILSGASFADEVINDEFTVIDLAGQNIQHTTSIAQDLSSSRFIVLPSTNVAELQLSGCFKNIVAILVGMLRGLGYRDNICSSVIAKGIEQTKLLADKMDDQNRNIILSVYSDIILTASSVKSRNMSFGMGIATNLDGPNQLTEGRLVIDALLGLAQRYGMKLPLIELASLCLQDQANLRQIIESQLHQIFSP